MLEEISARLSGVKYSGGYKCKCPCHDDSTASLSVNVDDSGRLIYNCFANQGCTYEKLTEWFASNGYIKTEPKVPEVLTDTYFYTDTIGEFLFEKQRWEGIKKRFVYRKKVHNKWVYKEVLKNLKEVPLYNLPALLSVSTSTIYIAEGEKNAKILIQNNLVATTNHDGAGKWLSHYNKWLRDKNIVICVDNDDAGRAHKDKIISSINKDVGTIKVIEFTNKSLKYDVYDYIKEHGFEAFQELVIHTPYWEPPIEIVDTKPMNELNQAIKELDAVEILNAVNRISKEKEKEKKEKRKQEYEENKVPKARYSDYVDLYKQVLGDIRKDIFSDDGMYLDSDNVWSPVAGALPICRSEAAEREADKILKFNQGQLFKDHYKKYESTLTRQLLVDIPIWDGQDRIGVFAKCLILDPNQGFTPEDADQLVTDWIVKAYRRIYNPNIRNRILILKGPQDIGKDWWMTSFLYGAGQYVKDMEIQYGDKDNFLQLSQAWFLKIGEFEKTARTDSGILKEMITKPFTDLRAPYGEVPKRRYCRCSFISGSNINDILRDPTGSTRYNIIEITGVKYDYPLESLGDGLQVLAQAKYLAEGGFKCADETEAKLKRYLDDRTPSNPADDVMEIFYAKLSEHIDKLSLNTRIEVLTQRRLPANTALPLIHEVSKLTDIRPRAIQNIINLNKAKVKSNGITYYIIPDNLISGSAEPEQYFPDGENENAIPF